MVSRTTTTAARATVSRPRYDRPGTEGSWSRTWTTTARKPLTARVGHSQRASDRAAGGGEGAGGGGGGGGPGGGPGGGGWSGPSRWVIGPSRDERARAAPLRAGSGWV